MLEFLSGYKIKALGLVWAALSVADGFFGVVILNSVDATNWVDHVIFGFGVFAGRDTVDALIARIIAEFKR